MQRQAGADAARGVSPAEVSPAPSSDVPESDLVPEVPATRTLPPGEWGSLSADLSRAPQEQPEWRVHDRTHLEFAVDYTVDTSAAEQEFEWEAYFFVPRSLRMNELTYPRMDMYADLQSYVRFGVPRVEFSALVEAPLTNLAKVWAASDDAAAVREARLFACLVRAAGGRERKRITEALASNHEDVRAAALARAQRMAADAGRLCARLREVLVDPPDPKSERAFAARWVDEDISKAVEALFGHMSRDLLEAKAPRQLSRIVRQVAVAEARYRMGAGLDRVGTGALSKRDVEHLEYRRHVLKRFTSSVLWLRAVPRDPAALAIHILYGLAASLAMAFALLMALWNGVDAHPERFWLWAGFVVIGYAGKDRMKAWLQTTFARIVAEKLPHRSWDVETEENRRAIGRVDERSGFIESSEVPEEVVFARRSTGRQSIEERSAPETVLRHQKRVLVRTGAVRGVDARFDAITEVFRLDLRRWLSHTDDPKRQILYADPVSGHVRSATAPRVYNIGVVYRRRRVGDTTAEWKRVRVVVSRKGIQRLEHVVPTVSE
jgi:hypothetical protein